jgi:hypothetical protein
MQNQPAEVVKVEKPDQGDFCRGVHSLLGPTFFITIQR